MIYFQGKIKKNYKRNPEEDIKAEPTENNQDGKQEQTKE
jgi:hypothetical protein